MNIEEVDWKKLLISIVVCQIPGILGSIFTVNSISTWYVSLDKPALVPPDWSFSIVWTLLYLLMGISLYIVWKRGWDQPQIKNAISLFGVQLFLNFLWSYLFFGLRSPEAGIVGIIVLWLSIAASILLFYRISRPAGILLLPYILWVTFAAYLNYSIMILNP